MANIRRKLREAGRAEAVTREDVAAAGAEPWSDDLWDLALHAAQIGESVSRAVEGLELSIVARTALDLAQKFNTLYHKHPILHEDDVELRTVRLAACQIFAGALAELCELLGIPVPERM